MKPSVFVTRRWPAAVEAKLAEDYNVQLNTGDKPPLSRGGRFARR